MGRYFTKRMFLLLTLIMLLPLLISSSSGESVNSDKNRVSIGKEGRFSSSASKGKVTDLEFEDLNMCKVFHGKTCCSASLMLSASESVKSLATYGDIVKDCLDLFEEIKSETIRICASFCDRVFESCSDVCFSSDYQVVVPCGASESIIMCGKAFNWESNGTAFCYAIQIADDSAEEPCYGSNSSLEPPVVEEPLIKTDNSGWLWFQYLRIVRPVTVIGLRTLLLKRWLYQHERRAMIQRDARR